MSSLNTSPNLRNVDAVYQGLIDLHQHRDLKERPGRMRILQDVTATCSLTR